MSLYNVYSFLSYKRGYESDKIILYSDVNGVCIRYILFFNSLKQKSYVFKGHSKMTCYTYIVKCHTHTQSI